MLQTFWEDVRAEMVDEKGLAPEAADKIGRFVKFQGNNFRITKVLRVEKALNINLNI